MISIKRILSIILKKYKNHQEFKSKKKKYKLYIINNDYVKFNKNAKFWLNKGFSATSVSLYNLNKNNYKDYLSEFDRWMLRNINGDFKILLDNKQLFHDITKSFLNMPKLLGLLNNNKFYDAQGNEKTIIDFSELDFPIIFKPTSSGGGHGFKIVNFKHNDFFVNNMKIMKDKLFSFLGNGIFEEIIKQHPFFSKFYSNSVNTLRIITINDNGSFVVTNALLRMGTKQSCFVDNASSGGIFATIDLNKKTLGAAHSYFNKEKYFTHPDTHQNICGEKIVFLKRLATFVSMHIKNLII